MTANVIPFRGVVYNQDKVDITKVVAPPYDKISPELQEKLYQRDPHNYVYLHFGKIFPQDTEASSRYTRSAETRREWIDEKILVKHGSPSFYPYEIEFIEPGKPGSAPRKLKGFIALLRTSSAKVYEHEHTLLGPRKDRLSLMHATSSQFGPVYMLYSDPDDKAFRILENATTNLTPFITTPDQFGDIHKMWCVDDSEVTKSVEKLLDQTEFYIADGHHRFNTAKTYAQELSASGVKIEGRERAEYCLCFFTNAGKDKPTILPTHRLVKPKAGFDRAKFLATLAEEFEIHEYPWHNEIDQPRMRQEFLEDLRLDGTAKKVIGLAMKGERAYRLLTLKDFKRVKKFLPARESLAYQQLTIVVLHSLILEHYLGITSDEIGRGEHIGYQRHIEDALASVENDDFEIAFLLNPTKIEEMLEVAKVGGKMPQKSTDFYPKLMSGLVHFEVQK
ncbi:MAG: DUF1015 domain-containing protein [Planctomycetes bacterium]|nr:DUF1015 domain-containing protein [Planctomycetota bacterium]